MQFGEAGRPPQGVIYDSSFGESIDTVLALALLHGFEGKNQSRTVALSISKPNLKAAQVCDVIEKFYASATTGLAAMFFQGLPIGLATDGKLSEDTPILTGTLDKKNEYSPRIQKLNDTAIPEVLMRNALTAQHDGNAVMVMAGPASNVAKVLALKDASSLIASKVKLLVMVGGDLENGKPDVNFSSNPAAMKRVLAEWPTPIVVVGREAGNQLLFPAASIEKDFAYAPNHPVAQAYRAARAMPYDAPTWSLIAALYAIRPGDGYFRLSDTGTLSITDDGKPQFQPSANGKHRYLLVDPAQKERVIKMFTEMASAKPVPRQFRRPQQQQQKPEEKEKPSDSAKPAAQGEKKTS